MIPHNSGGTNINIQEIMIHSNRLRSSHFHAIFLGFCLLVASSFLFQSTRLLHSKKNGGDNDDGRSLLAGDSRPRAIFYNIYIPSGGKMFRAMNIVQEQLVVQAASRFAATAPVYYNLIGVNATDEIQAECGKQNTNCQALQYAERGDEGLTLQSLYDYCQEYPDTLVTYLHDKGSLHPTPKNRHFRSLLTKGAFTDECQSIGGGGGGGGGGEDPSCNICGARFSPFPHMHVAGNMWTAQCSYINRLIPPNQFAEKMESLMESVLQAVDPSVPRPTFQQYEDEYFVGRNRFAMEHWIGSHPSVKPCDVYDGPYLCGYIDVPDSSTSWTPALQPAPRFPVSLFEKRAAKGTWFCGQARLLEFQYLYGERPPANSFVWTFYTEAFKTCLTPLNRAEHDQLFSNVTSIL